MSFAAWVLLVFYLARPACSRHEGSAGLAAVDIDAAGGVKPVQVQLMRKDAPESLGSFERATDQTRRHYKSKGSIRNIGPHTAYDTLAQETDQARSSQQLQGVDDKGSYEWSPWFSWDTPGRTSNHNHNPVRAMLCLNKMSSNCSMERNINLTTYGTGRSIRNTQNDLHITQNDNKRKLHCPEGRVVTAASCATEHCERMDVTCSKPKGWALGDQVTETVEFSEKTGGMSMCDDGYYMYGLSCAKEGCQVKTLYCKKYKKLQE